MRERPLLMKGPLVLQTLAGVKSQTRRLCKLDYRPGMPEPELRSLLASCPYGVPGDRLWIRETWRAVHFSFTESYQACYRADEKLGGEVIDWTDPRAEQAGRFWDGDLRWFPGIHMPRWACRLVLEITDVRVERLQDIGEADILAEGITVDRVAEWCNTPWSVMPTLHHAWRVLWESINGAGSWEANPLVWVISFRRVV